MLFRPKKLPSCIETATDLLPPDINTGLGGKTNTGFARTDRPGFPTEIETAEEGAKRELGEEVPQLDGRVKLSEVARCITDGIGGHNALYYFWGEYSEQELPPCNEGKLEWVSINDVLKKDIIPTTWNILKIWQERGFSTDQPFTLFVREKNRDARGLINPEIIKIQEGLVYD